MKSARCFIVRCHFLTCAVLLCAPLSSSAAPITVPRGSNPGDQFRLAFVTSSTRGVFSSNLDDDSAFLSGVANTFGEVTALGTTWKAIGNSTTVDSMENTETNLNCSAPIGRDLPNTFFVG
jgi:hypothetical protein